MTPIEPLPLHHSWPLADADARFDLGLIHECRGPGIIGGSVGRWACDLSDDTLTWSDEVHVIFGLPRHAIVSRGEAVALYTERSRAAMERLRGHAIRHRRGFTLDTLIRPPGSRDRWMRLIAAPICAGQRVVGLHGVKQDVSALYRPCGL